MSDAFGRIADAIRGDDETAQVDIRLRNAGPLGNGKWCWELLLPERVREKIAPADIEEAANQMARTFAFDTYAEVRPVWLDEQAWAALQSDSDDLREDEHAASN